MKYPISIKAEKIKKTTMAYTYRKSMENTLKFDKNKPETLDERILKFIDEQSKELKSLFE